MIEFKRVCSVCDIDKPLSDFYSDKTRLFGKSYRCKVCTHLYYKGNKARLLSNQLEHNREYSHTEGARELKVASAHRMMEKYPERYQVRNTARNALKSGKLVRQPCEVCKEPKAEMHHDDYDKPLDVRWLCPLHHRELEGRLKADQLKEILTGEEKELHYKIPDTEEERTEGAVEKLLELEALAKMYRILHLSENYPVDLIIDWEDISEDDKAHYKKQAAQLKEKLTGGE